MPAENHSAYEEELQHCNYVLSEVENSLNATVGRKERVDKSIDKAKRGINSDSSQEYIDTMVNTLIKGSLDVKLINLIKARKKPYFARIDFKEGQKEFSEKIYIGKMSLIREEDQGIVIVDWRAPIASLYYEERLGDASYNCPDGNIMGEISLKRQFTINEGKLEEIFDIDITTNDEFLQGYLGASADNRLKDIVSTIQVEQNRIIRADMWTPLIVQGAAGSGKTTIALHRIAYLIYSYEKTFDPDNFMIIAPNRLFLNYISEVLPELGVEKVKQTTFEDFVIELIGKKLKIRDSDDKLDLFVNYNGTKEDITRNDFIKQSSKIKSSMLFKEIMDTFVAYVEKDFIPKEDFKIYGRMILSYEDINNLFQREYKQLPIVKRIDEIKKHLSNRLKSKKSAIITGLEEYFDKKVFDLKLNMEPSDERQKLIIKAIDRKNDEINKLESYSKNAVNEYIKKISKFSPYDYYKEFIMNDDLYHEIVGDRIEKDLAEFTRQYTERVLESGFIEIEDIAPIVYLKYSIHGIDEKIPVRHIVIDEAQDFNVFQLYVLRKIVKDSSFTILGDLCQGIHSYRGMLDWNDVYQSVFEGKRCQYLTLEQSYRTTVEIMDAANKVISHIKDKNLVLGKPVIRHGERVRILEKESIKDIADSIAKNIETLLKDNFNSIAIICKTMDECQTILSYLKKLRKELSIITGKEKEYKSGIVIVPSYLSKGLEFDAVIIANAGDEQYRDTELDIKLLYVAMTRPLHKLYIYYHGNLSPLLEGID